MLLGVHLDIWKQGQTFMNHKNWGVWNHWGFFWNLRASLPPWHICMPKFPHYTKEKVIFLFLPHSSPFTCVFCATAVQYSEENHYSKKKNTLAASFDQTLTLKTLPFIVGLLKIHPQILKKGYSCFQCSTQTEITQIDYLYIQNPTITKLFVTEKFSPSRLDLTNWCN